MSARRKAGILISSLLLALFSGCTGGQESSAETLGSNKHGAATPESGGASATERVEARTALKTISPAIPLYANAQFRADLTRRDSVMVKNQYGPDSQVYTLGTADSFPQVYHYYVTYLAQFRAYNPPPPYPPENRNWRTIEVQLNQAMQDPFIPGEALRMDGKQVTLQIAETEAQPPTVIRYIVTSNPVQTPVMLQ